MKFKKNGKISKVVWSPVESPGEAKASEKEINSNTQIRRTRNQTPSYHKISMSTATNKTRYDGDNIVVLEGLEPVRKRPGMYIGGVGTAGLHHLIWEILDNSVDEAMNGHATEITLQLHKDGETVTISDNGRGIPVDKHSKTKKSALETVLTVLHAGGKFDGNNYKTAGGLHGVGASVVNALSKKLVAIVKRGGTQYRMSSPRDIRNQTFRNSKVPFVEREPRLPFLLEPKLSSLEPTSMPQLFGIDSKLPASSIAGLKFTLSTTLINQKKHFIMNKALWITSAKFSKNEMPDQFTNQHSRSVWRIQHESN